MHERCMRLHGLIYADKTSSFEELLEQGKSVSIRTRNLQMLAIEMFKVYRSISRVPIKASSFVIHESLLSFDKSGFLTSKQK